MSDFYYKKAKKYKLKYLNLKQEYIGGAEIKECNFEASQKMMYELYHPVFNQQILNDWMEKCSKDRLVKENSPGVSSEEHIVDRHDEFGKIIYQDKSDRNQQYLKDMEEWNQKQEQLYQQQQHQHQQEQHEQPEPEPEPEPEKPPKKKKSCTIS